MDKKKISIIIPNFNGGKLLEKNLPAVIRASKKYSSDTEIIVIDDASDDNSKDLLSKFIPQVEIILKTKNEGFSSTCNVGVKAARGDIVVLLNTDISPEIDFLDPLVSHFKDKDVFAVGCLDLSMEDGKEVERGRGIGRFERGFLLHAKGNIDNSNTLWASGGSSAFDRNKWMELNGMDEIYNPFYYEDIDLSFRALKKGWKIIFDKKAVVHHNHKEGAIQSKYSAEKIKTIAYRNQFIFTWKNTTQIKCILQHYIWLPYHLIKAFIRSDYSFFKGFFEALILLLTKIPKKTTEEKKSWKKLLKKTVNKKSPRKASNKWISENSKI